MIYAPAAVWRRLACNLPADSAPYVICAMVIVNGDALTENGRHTVALPGHVLRGG